MGKSKKSKKPRPRSATTNPQPYGFDYGCLPYAMAVSTVELVNHLTRASTDAVAYGSVWSDAVKATFKDETKRDRRVGLQEDTGRTIVLLRFDTGRLMFFPMVQEDDDWRVWAMGPSAVRKPTPPAAGE